MNTDNTSSVAVLMQQIDDEWNAARRAMYEPAIVSSHQAITRRLENVGVLHDKLVNVIGEQEATEFIVRMMEGER